MVTKKDPLSIFDSSFPQQLAFVKDPHKLKSLWCTRRSAKSFTAGLYMIYEALTNPGCNCLFLGLTRQSAKEIIWKDILKILNRKHKFRAQFNETELTMTFPNGSVIRVAGVDATEDEMLKYLGKKYRLACIDEASMYTINVRNLVYGILKPAMTDQDGSICLFGTSSDFPKGLFFDITQGKEQGWSLHTWSAHDNPYVSKRWQEELDEIARERPLYMETPQYRQWYLNEWVVDDNKLVYRYSEQRNLYKDLPFSPVTPSGLPSHHHTGWSFILGVDFGWEDDNAFVLTGYHINDPNMYVIKSYKKPKMTYDQVIEKVQEFQRDPIFAPHKIIVDVAAKQGVESMRQRSSIPFEYAEKQGKVEFIEILNGDFIQGLIKIHPSNRSLIDELTTLVWKTDGDKILLPKKEHPALPNHLCFVAGTLVHTPNGQVAIEDLQIGDTVITETGDHQIQSCMTSIAETLSLTLSTGEVIVTTPNHPFKVGKEWIAAEKLLGKSLTVRPISYVQERDTSRELTLSKASQQLNSCIEQSGVTITEQFQRDITSTTSMKTEEIMTLAISDAFLQKNTIENIHRQDLRIVLGQRTSNTWLQYNLLQSFGMPQQKVSNGIEQTDYPNLFQRFAQSAVFSIKETKRQSIASALLPVIRRIESRPRRQKDSAPIVVKPTTPTSTERQDSVQVHAVTTLGLNKVYNISVATDPTYYVGSGILVSNCDALLYNWRMGYHYQAVPIEKKIVVGSRDWYMQQSVGIWEKEKERLIEEQDDSLEYF